MNKLTYILESVKNENYLNRGWLIKCFSEINLTEDSVDYDLIVKDGRLYVQRDSLIELKDYVEGGSIIESQDEVTIPGGLHPMIPEKIDTTYGILMNNMLLYWYPYKGKAKYIEEYTTPQEVNDIAYKILIADDGTVDEYVKFEGALSMLTVISQCVVPSASRKSITPNPIIPAIRDKLIAENKDNMTDPVTVAKIQSELVRHDKEYLKDDVSKDFFIAKKQVNMTRLREFGMYGAEPDFYDETKVKVMSNSLSEGWGVDDMPMLINSIRGAAQSRSVSTALGGVEVKNASRAFQNYKINDIDCKSTVGDDYAINKLTLNEYVGRTLTNGTLIKENDLSIGQKISVRSPATCLSPGGSVCRVCIGKAVVDTGLGLNALTLTVTSTFLNIFMALTHTAELSLTKYDYKDRIS